MQIAPEVCITDKNKLIEDFTKMRKSLDDNRSLYNEVYPFVETSKDMGDGYNTTGKETETLNNQFLEIKPTVSIINNRLANTFRILKSFNGDLNVLTNCFIFKRQLMIIEPGFCFDLMPIFFKAAMFILIVNICLMGVTWGVFLSIKYAGDLGVKGSVYVWFVPNGCLLVGVQRGGFKKRRYKGECLRQNL